MNPSADSFTPGGGGGGGGVAPPAPPQDGRTATVVDPMTNDPQGTLAAISNDAIIYPVYTELMSLQQDMCQGSWANVHLRLNGLLAALGISAMDTNMYEFLNDLTTTYMNENRAEMDSHMAAQQAEHEKQQRGGQ